MAIDITYPEVSGRIVATPDTSLAVGDMLYLSDDDPVTWVRVPRGQLPATATNDDAAAGKIGEIIVSEVLAASAVALTTVTAVNVTSISLTAGDWDVSGNVVSTPASGTLVTQVIAWISTTSATLPTAPNKGAEFILNVTFAAGPAGIAVPTGTMRLSLSATTTVYLSTRQAFTVSTSSAFGYLQARRVR